MTNMSSKMGSGDMAKMFKQVKDLYDMHTDSNTDRRINTLCIQV